MEVEIDVKMHSILTGNIHLGFLSTTMSPERQRIDGPKCSVMINPTLLCVPFLDEDFRISRSFIKEKKDLERIWNLKKRYVIAKVQ